MLILLNKKIFHHDDLIEYDNNFCNYLLLFELLALPIFVMFILYISFEITNVVSLNIGWIVNS